MPDVAAPAPAPSNEMPSIESIVASMKSAPAPAIAPEAVGEVAAAPEAAVEAAPEAAVATSPDQTPAPLEAPQEEKKDPASAKFAALARKEKELRTREAQSQAAAKATEDRLKAMEDRLTARLKEVEDRDAAIKGAKRPLDLLKAAGFKYEDATNDVLGGYKPAEEDPLDARLKPFQEKLNSVDALQKKLEDLQQQLAEKENTQNYRQVMDTIKHTVTAAPDKYEFLNKFGDKAIELVKDTMVEYSQTNVGQYLSYDEAAQLVEEHYEELAAQFTATKKAQAKFGTPAPAPQQSQTKQPVQPTKTLTSSLQSTGSAAVNVDNMSRKDAIAHLTKQLRYL